VPEQLLKAIYGTGSIPNPMSTILRQQDSLKLTSVQADSIAALNRAYTIQTDAIWTPVAKYFAELPKYYDQSVAYDRYIQARKASVDLLMKIAPIVKDLLTAEQRRKLPPFVASYLEPRYLASIRSGTATFTGGSGFGAGDRGVFAGVETFVAGVAGPGAGGNVTIIRQ
jgi:hypothetical protein